MPEKPRLDHTGEIWHNRRITGWGDFKRSNCGKTQWAWKWHCLDCGADGVSTSYQMLKVYGHPCKGKLDKKMVLGRPPGYYLKPIPYQPPPKKPVDRTKVCGRQCWACGHYDGRSCVYILDTGHMRPKVALNREPCPVRDTHFKRSTVTLAFGVETPEGQMDLRRRQWRDENEEGNK